MAYTNEQLGKALEDLTAAYNNFIEKAKEAAIAAMGDTVIAQIKQDAKDYIAAELAEQKAALEQAIEQAKIALKNSSDEAHVKLQQFSEEKQQELSALVEESKNALTLLAEQKFENLKTLVTAEEKKLKDLADNETVKLQEVAAASKKETENAVLQAKRDLEEQGNAISLKIGNEMQNQLNTFGENLVAKIIEAKTGIITEIKTLNDKLEGDMSKIADIMIYKDAINVINFISISNNNLYFKIKNLKNTPLMNAKKEIIRPELYTNRYDYKSFECKLNINNSMQNVCEVHTDTVTNIYFFEHLNSNDKIIIKGCFFLEYVYLRSLEDSQKKVLKFIDCPNFKGFKEYKGDEEV